MKYLNIAISGDIGTGTTTLAKALSTHLGWGYWSAGDFFRTWHKENKIPLERTDQVPEDIDREIDGRFQEMMKKDADIVFESHLAGWLARDYAKTFKILCVSSPETAVKRVAGREHISTEEARILSKERIKYLDSKFKKLYKVTGYLNPKYFDLVINTSNLTRPQVLEKALAGLQK